MDGSKVWEAFHAGLKDIRDYCETDGKHLFNVPTLPPDERRFGCGRNYEVEVKRMKHYLTGQAQDKQHEMEFVAAWR